MFSVNSYARHRGCFPRAVQVAIARGRLKECVVYDAAGKAKITDFHTADAEWKRNTNARRQTRGKDAEANRNGTAPAGDGEGGSRPGPKPASMTTESGEIITAADATARERYWKAETAELDFKRKSGELVDAAAVQSEWAAMIAQARHRLLSIPSKAKSALHHLTLTDVETIERLIRDALEGLANGERA